MRKEGRQTGPEDLEPQVLSGSVKGQSRVADSGSIAQSTHKLIRPAYRSLSIHPDSELLTDRLLRGHHVQPLSACARLPWTSSVKMDKASAPLPSAHLHSRPLSTSAPFATVQTSRLRKLSFLVTTDSLGILEPKQSPIESH